MNSLKWKYVVLKVEFSILCLLEQTVESFQCNLKLIEWNQIVP